MFILLAYRKINNWSVLKSQLIKYGREWKKSERKKIALVLCHGLFFPGRCHLRVCIFFHSAVIHIPVRETVWYLSLICKHTPICASICMPMGQIQNDGDRWGRENRKGRVMDDDVGKRRRGEERKRKGKGRRHTHDAGNAFCSINSLFVVALSPFKRFR